MTVETSTSRVQYATNGTTGPWSVPFYFLADADLRVVYADADGNESELTLTTHYSVSGAGVSSGGSITTVASYVAGGTLTVLRDMDATQPTDYANTDSFPAETLERNLDRLTMLAQQLMEAFDRAVTVPASENASLVLPGAAQRASRIMAFDANGDPQPIVGVDSSSASALALDLLSGDASKGSKLVTFLQTGTGASARLVQEKLSDIISVCDFGATGEGASHDDTAAIQAAFDEAQARVGAEVYFPPRDPGQYYKVTAPLTITAPIKIRGAGASAVQIIAPAGALSSGQYILDINCDSAYNVEHITVQGLTVRSLDAVPNGIRVKNAAQTEFTDVRVFNVANGIDFDGTRCYSNTFTRFVCYTVTNAGARWLSTFAGGGQFTWRACTFFGAYGVLIPAGALTDTLVFDGCNFEDCTTRAMLVNGTAQGVTLMGARGEDGTGNGFEFAPTSSHEVTGLAIHGMSYYNGTVAAVPIILGTAAGTGGRVRGFSITGNRVGYAGFSCFVQVHAEAQSGIIAGNHFAETTTQPVSANRPGVVVFGNENGAGRLVETWGQADWGVEQGTWTPTDGSGASLTFSAASGRYTKIGRMVFWQAFITYPVTANGSNAEVAGLPYVVGGLTGTAEGRAGARVDITNLGSAVGILQGVTGSQEFAFYGPTSGSAITNATLSGKYMYCSGSYMI